MARGVNKAIILGNLGQDPEVKYTPAGKAVCNISVATTYKSGDKEYTEWHRVVFFGKLAEIVGQYLRKGSQVYVEGRIQTRKWQDQSGADRYTTEIIANEMQMLGGKGGGQQSYDGMQAGPGLDEPGAAFNSTPAPQPSDDFDDDIPF